MYIHKHPKSKHHEELINQKSRPKSNFTYEDTQLVIYGDCYRIFLDPMTNDVLPLTFYAKLLRNSYFCYFNAVKWKVQNYFIVIIKISMQRRNYEIIIT